MAVSPTAEGFRVGFRRPALTFAEIMWRWAVGATATALSFFGFFEYLSTLPVSRGERLLLRSGNPSLVGQALAHILRGTGKRVVIAGLLAALLLGLFWVVAASLGRMATVRALLDYFRGRFVGAGVAQGIQQDGGAGVATDVSFASAPGAPFRLLVQLNALRAAAFVAAAFGTAGAFVLTGLVSSAAHPRPGLAFLLFLPLAGLVWAAWCMLNWFLSLSGVFAVRDAEGVLEAITAAVTLCRERSGAVMAVSTWTWLAHVVAFVSATTVISAPLSLVAVSGRLALLGVMVLSLVYFAVADWLYMARLAGYVCIAELPESLLRAATSVPTPKPPLPVVSTIDRDEPILSDVPNLVPET